MRQDPGDVGGGDEDPGTDHRTNGQQRGVPATEAADEAFRGESLLWIRAHGSSFSVASLPLTYFPIQAR